MEVVFILDLGKCGIMPMLLFRCILNKLHQGCQTPLAPLVRSGLQGSLWLRSDTGAVEEVVATVGANAALIDSSLPTCILSKAP